MNDAELIRDFIRLEMVGEGFVLEAAVIEWPCPSEPVLSWNHCRRWKKKPNDKKLASTIAEVLNDKRFFGVCKLCGERNNKGHMHEKDVCQSCAEQHFDVVY